MSRPRYSLRRKLMASSLIMLALGGLLSLFAGSRLIRGAFLSQAQAKVRHDLASAWMVFDGKIEDIKDVVRMTAARESLVRISALGVDEAILTSLKTADDPRRSAVLLGDGRPYQ